MMNQNEKNTQKRNATALLGLNRATRVGSWTVAMTLIVLAVLVVVNLLVGALPSTWTRLDTTDQGMYTVSTTTKNFVKTVDREVRIIALNEGGTISGTLQTFLDRYSAINSRIRVKVVDPVADPTFLEKYSQITTSGNYLIVESDLRHTIVDIAALEYYYVPGYGEMDTATYAELTASEETVAMIYQYYGYDMNAATLYFSGEKELTAAIEYVTLSTIPHVYELSGNGEAALSNALTGMFDLALLEHEPLTLNAGEGIPEDASALIINAPQYDISAEAAATIRTFLADGGNLILVTTPDNATMPNLMSVVADCGVTPTTGGMLYEGNANRYAKEPYNLFPTVNPQHAVTYAAVSSGYSLVMPRAHGILVAESLPEGVSVTPLFSATDAYTVAADGTEADFGAVATGVAIENKTSGSKVVWFASLDAFTDSAGSVYGSGATYFFAIATSWVDDAYASTFSVIEAVDMTEQPMNVSFMAMAIFGCVLVLALPITLIVAGVVVWSIRRKR